MEDPMQVWDRRYAEYGQTRSQQAYDYWLEDYHSDLEATGRVPVLDLGCGTGHDTAYLNSIGCRVVAADFSREAAKIVRRRVPAAQTVLLNIGAPPPFQAMPFHVVIASLSLHYFSMAETKVIVGGIRDCLRRDGVLLARFNSASDDECLVNGQLGKPQSYLFVDEVMKRFFSHAEMVELFGPGWQLRELEECRVSRYGKEKVIWRVAAQRHEL